MALPQTLPVYDLQQTYLENYGAAPEPVDVSVPVLGQEWDFCGLPTTGPLGVPAGPLLNGKWCLYYASLGFDVVTYKTVRSGRRDCYALPNLVPVTCGDLKGSETRLSEASTMSGSWAVSFGMPSTDPDVWRRDIEATRKRLPDGKILSVSVVGTVQDGWSIDDLAADYANCAKWAIESGADCIETNFSCPNVSTCDGQLYQNVANALIVTQRVRQTIGAKPFIIKIGHVTQNELASQVVEELGPVVDAMAMTNSVATTVEQSDGELLFDGQPRGICGRGTYQASLTQAKHFASLIKEKEQSVKVIAVGGIASADQVQESLEAGAHAAHIATAAMVNPAIALEIKQAMIH